MKRTSWLIHLPKVVLISALCPPPWGGMNKLRNIFKINLKNLVNKGIAQTVPSKTEVRQNLRWEKCL